MAFFSQKRVNFSGLGRDHQRPNHGAITLHRHGDGQNIAAFLGLTLGAGRLTAQRARHFSQPQPVSRIDFAQKRGRVAPDRGPGLHQILHQPGHGVIAGHWRQRFGNHPRRAVHMRAVEHQSPIARIQSEARHGDQTGARQNRFGIAQLPIRATAILQQPVHDRGFEKLKRVLRLRGRGQSTGNQIGLGL